MGHSPQPVNHRLILYQWWHHEGGFNFKTFGERTCSTKLWYIAVFLRSYLCYLRIEARREKRVHYCILSTCLHLLPCQAFGRVTCLGHYHFALAERTVSVGPCFHIFFTYIYQFTSLAVPSYLFLLCLPMIPDALASLPFYLFAFAVTDLYVFCPPFRWKVFEASLLLSCVGVILHCNFSENVRWWIPFCCNQLIAKCWTFSSSIFLAPNIQLLYARVILYPTQPKRYRLLLYL